jgi:hypothetical protein
MLSESEIHSIGRGSYATGVFVVVFVKLIVALQICSLLRRRKRGVKRGKILLALKIKFSGTKRGADWQTVTEV